MIDALLKRNLVPDAAIRAAIRWNCRLRLKEQCRQPGEERLLVEGPVALHTDAANEQHYELPPRFFELVLGPHRKYSSAYWPDGDETLAQAEEKMLERTMAAARLANGQRILELGCGWGSLTLTMAARFRDARIVAVSNSTAQRDYILAVAAQEGLDNIDIVTADMNDFDPGERFDRIVSVEMFEHMRNWQELLRRCGNWLAEDGEMFIHIFCHRHFCYPYEVRDATDWMAKYFFTGGLMPDYGVFQRFPDLVAVAQEEFLPGWHYQKTAEAWLRNLDAHRDEVLELFAGVYGPRDASLWLQRWRIFFMACAEMFGFRGGAEWGVGHYRLRPVRGARVIPMSTREVA
ncbi:MAG: class I SAM-dependent methyltransferase [Candidatus Dadabacteria bacterium]|nr:MAG: class I SAM-dependent methyltransferase [Candidatus Dadabacteria bacterium]